MNLWGIENGWMGNGWVTCLVEAETESEAIELAKQEFAKEADKDGNKGEKYYQELKAMVITLPAIVELS